MIELEQITAYKLASELSDTVWRLVVKWPYLAKKTIGEQLIRSIDSVAGNIAEAEGRYFKRDKMKFLYYSRGSLYESAHWIEKAKARKLLTDKQYANIMLILKKLPKEINYLIANFARNLKR